MDGEGGVKERGKEQYKLFYYIILFFDCFVNFIYRICGHLRLE